MNNNIKIYPDIYSVIGIAGTTKVHTKMLDNGQFEAKMGIAIMGNKIMSEYQLKNINYNPFSHEFFDNYVNGFGNTEPEAIGNMVNDLFKKQNLLFNDVSVI